MKKLYKTLRVVLAVTGILLLAACSQPEDETHKHSYKTEWSTDAENHWHAADCEHTDKTKDKASHKFGKAETVEATCKTDGSKTTKCEVCGYAKVETIEKTTAHVWDEGKVVKAASCTEEGQKKYTCTVCKAEKTEVIAKLPHTVTGVAWTSDAENHWHEGNCSVCGNKVAVDKAAHVWDKGVINETEFKKTYTCTTCGATKNQNVVIKSFTDFFAELGNDVTKITANATETPGVTKEGTVANVYGVVLTGSTSGEHFPSSLLEADLTGVDTSKVTDMSYMFYGCSSLTSLDVSKFDTSNVFDMNGMFCDCSRLESLDVSKFDTSKVTGMYCMFGGCNGLTSLDVSKFDTSNVTDMICMFSDCNGLTSLDVSKFDTSKVTGMRSMFSDCNGLTSLDVSKFDTSNVTDMGYMFYGCSSLTSLDVSKFDTSKVYNMDCLFYGCSSLTSLDVSKFDTSKVYSFANMFRGCSGLTSLDVSKFDISKVSGMFYMFYGCSSLTSLNLCSFNTSNVTSFDKNFDCTGKINAPLDITVKSGKWTLSTDAVNNSESNSYYKFTVID